MKILYVNYEYPPLGGGGGVFNQQVAEEIAKKCEVTVLTSHFGNLPEREIVNGVEVVRCPVLFRKDKNAANLISLLSFYPSSLKVGKKLLSEKKFDIVNSFFAIPSAPSGLKLARKFGLPHVVSLMGGDVYDPSKALSPHKTPILHQVVKKMLDKSDVATSISIDLQKRAFEYYRLKKEPKLIFIGIPKAELAKKTRKEFGLAEEDIVFVTVARLVRRKAIEVLIRLVKRLDNPRIKLVVVGDGPQKEAWRGLSVDLGIEKQIIFTGFVSNDEKFQLLDVSDIYLSSSQHEGFGIVFLEAMAMGLPVVCYDKGGQADYLLDGKTGYLIPYGDEEFFLKKLQEMISNKSVMQSMSDHNLEYIKSFYISHCAEQFLSLYQALLTK